MTPTTTTETQATKQPAVIDDKTMQMIQRELLKMPDHERAAVINFLKVTNRKQLMAKPTREDLRFRAQLQKAMKLDKDLSPIMSQISSHFLDVLEKRDLELFMIYMVLMNGSAISVYAPRHLAASELSKQGSMKIYYRQAAKAEKLLKAPGATKPGQKPASSSRAQNKAAAGARTKVRNACD